jgi:uncharacterized membrane protein (DUF106 family)
VTVLNQLLTSAFDVLLWPLGLLPALAGLTLVSLLTAVVCLLVVKRTANEATIVSAKNGMQAAIFEMRLFNDNLRAMWRAQLDAFRHNGRYLAASLVPMLWLIVPLGLLFVHLDAYFAQTGLVRGEPALVEARVRDDLDPARVHATLTAPDGIDVTTPPLGFAGESSIVWQVVPHVDGSFALHLRTDSVDLAKTLEVSTRVARRSATRTLGGFWRQLAAPSEPPLPPGGEFTSISIRYPDRTVPVFGTTVSWVVVYLVLSIALMLALKRPLRVTM